MQQLTTDLRARFANVIESERQAAQEAAQAPAKADTNGRSFMTERRTKLFRDMLFERFAPEQAEKRFASAMERIATAEARGGYRAARAEFDGFYTWLRIQPKLAASDRPARTSGAVEVTVPLIEGKFTVVFEDGSHKTLRIRRQHEDAKFMPGRLLIGHLVGPDNDNDYTNVGNVTESGKVAVWKKHRDNERLAEAIRVLVGDPKAAAAAYAEKSGNCAKCGRTLTAPVEENPFRAVGLGPECGKQAGW